MKFTDSFFSSIFGEIGLSLSRFVEFFMLKGGLPTEDNDIE
jgi:hypothetical protein